jgi:UDP-2,4-diacetamido-2,4,6-trideoxy-beta-L-altropyranose hydrolase
MSIAWFEACARLSVKDEVAVASRTLLIRADAGPEIGLGHALRCLAIAQAWNEAGGSSRFAMIRGAEVVRGRLDAEAIGVTILGRDDEIVECAREASWVVLDRYGLSPDLQERLRASGSRVAVVDDAASTGRYSADLVIDSNAFANEQMYAQRATHTRMLLGPTYALLRREMRATAAREHTDRPQRLLVTIGGADVQDVAPRVITAASAMMNVELRVIIGPAARRESVELAARGRSGIDVVYDPPDMAVHLTWADVAIAGAGGTCLELAHFGVPTLAIVTADNQRPVATRLAELGTLRSLGEASALTTEAISDALAALFDDEPGRRAMSAIGRALVDGRGAQRVVQTMLELA